MTQDHMNALYCECRRYGVIVFDLTANEIIRLMRINMPDEMVYQVTLYHGEVFAITEVTE